MKNLSTLSNSITRLEDALQEKGFLLIKIDDASPEAYAVADSGDFQDVPAGQYHEIDARILVPRSVIS